MTEATVLLLTAPSESAEDMARMLVERGLAACVSLSAPQRSIYRWQGAIEEAEETLLIVKTLAEHVAAIDAAVRDVHPYEVYELLALPVSSGNDAYLRWIEDAAR